MPPLRRTAAPRPAHGSCTTGRYVLRMPHPPPRAARPAPPADPGVCARPGPRPALTALLGLAALLGPGPGCGVPAAAPLGPPTATLPEPDPVPTGGPPCRDPAALACLVDEPPELLRAEGALRLERLRWRSDEDNGSLYRVHMPREAAVAVLPTATLAELPDFLPDTPGPWAAIDGGFYGLGEIGLARPIGLVRHEGVEHAPLRGGGGSGVLLAGPGPAQIVHRDDPAVLRGGKEALQSVDRIVSRGRALVGPKAVAKRDARSVIALSDDGVWLLAVVSSRSERPDEQGVRLAEATIHGPTLAELTQLVLAATDADTALNLDGAVSTQMVVKAGPVPWVLRGERGTLNAVRVGP